MKDPKLGDWAEMVIVRLRLGWRVIALCSRNVLKKIDPEIELLSDQKDWYCWSEEKFPTIKDKVEKEMANW